MTVPKWRLSGFYFFYFAALGSFLPFWSLFLASRGFDALAIGELSALLVGTKIIAPNIWGWMADYTGKSMRIIRLASLLAALFFAGFLWVNGYFSFVFVTLVFSFFWNAALPQFEAVTLGHLATESQRYAQIRLWGSVGFIVAVLGIGRLLDFQKITILPEIILVLLILSWLVTLVTPESKNKKSKHLGKGSVWGILKQAEVLAFLGVNLILQIAHSPYNVFFSVYLKQLHFSASLTGFLWALGVVSEIVLFLLMRQILAYVSIRKILLWGIVLSGLRWYLIAEYAQFIWVIIVTQILHAASFGAIHVVAMSLLQRYFGSLHQGKGQALYASASFGVGGMIGGYLSGFYWAALGAESVFLLASGCCLLAWLVAFIWVGREKANNTMALG